MGELLYELLHGKLELSSTSIASASVQDASVVKMDQGMTETCDVM
jgi:hypothetical protein